MKNSVEMNVDFELANRLDIWDETDLINYINNNGISSVTDVIKQIDYLEHHKASHERMERLIAQIDYLKKYI